MTDITPTIICIRGVPPDMLVRLEFSGGIV